MPTEASPAISLGFLMHDVSRLRRVALDRALKPLGVTRSWWTVLAFLSVRDGMTQTAVAADLDLTKVGIGGLLERMEAAGLVQRRPDAYDARVRRVYLTKSGRRLLEQSRGEVERFEREALGPCSDEELQTTANALRRMKESLLRMIGDNGDQTESDPELIATPKGMEALKDWRKDEA
jgi:DNA-binding MarR family transcriptional regulator